jgi:hypothetical protein
LGILKALDPPRTDVPSHSQKALSEDRFTIHSDSSHRDRDRDREKDSGEKKDKWPFWNRDKDREKDRGEREREGARGKDRREDDGQAELTRLIGMISLIFCCSLLNVKLSPVLGYLTATASEDWALVLEVCERASANETNAKEAIRALRREFKYILYSSMW